MIDLSKDPGFQKKLTDVELTDNQGINYKYAAVTASQGFPGFVAECRDKKKYREGEPQPRHVRLTEELVYVPHDLAGEFIANLAARLQREAIA